MEFFPGYNYDDYGYGSGWPWGFASTPRGGGGYSYADPYERRRAYYPGKGSFHSTPSQNYGRRVPPHARGPAYEPVSDGWSNYAQAPAAHMKKQTPAHVKKQAAQNKAPEVIRVVPISEPASSKAPRFVAKEDAAIKIQSVFRGYAVRHTKPLCSLRKIAETKGKLVDFKNQVSDQEKMRLVRENMKERIVLTEGVMNLLLQLDSIQGALPIVREIRKATVREIVQLQERIDSILQQKEPEKSSESEESSNGEMELEKSSESAQESGEGANAEMELGKPFESALESSEGTNEEMEDSNKQMESSHEGEQASVKAGDENMDISACDNAEAGEQIIKDEEDLNMDTGADNVEAGAVNISADSLEAAQNTGDNVEAAQDPGAVNSIEAEEMLDDHQAQDSMKDAAMMGAGAVNIKGDNLEAAQEIGAVNNIEADEMVDDFQAQDSEKEAPSEQLDQNVLKTQALSLEETDGEKSKQGTLEIEDGAEVTQDEVEGECRCIVDAVVDEAVHKAESRKREREENEEQESDATGKAGPDDYMKIMVKLVDENAQLKKLVADCLKQTELQNALICHLNDRVQKLEKKAKRNKKKDAKLSDLF